MDIEDILIIINIKTILMRFWDPIGVAKYYECYREYDFYIPEIYKIIEKCYTKNEIYDYLRKIEINMMEVKNDTSHTMRAAHELSCLVPPDKRKG